MHVDKDVIDAAQLPERDLDLREGRAPGTQVEVAAYVHDPQSKPGMLDHADAASRLAAQEVDGPHDALVMVEIRVDLTTVIGVVPQRDRIDAGREHLVGVLRRDAQSTRRVLAVDDDEAERVALAQHRQAVEQRLAADSPDHVSDEQDSGLGRVRLRTRLGGP